eukprot:m.60928 g.60928  ORF g.60928 m.60928 type:complete len:323 (-) comp7989_c0_seq1:90-1058(-)
MQGPSSIGIRRAEHFIFGLFIQPCTPVASQAPPLGTISLDDNLHYYRIRAACPSVGPSGLCQVQRNPLPAAARPSGDSCTVSNMRYVLPARLDCGRTAAFAWKEPSSSTGGPDFQSVQRIPAGGTLSLSASRHDLVQVSSQADLDSCTVNNARLLHDFTNNGSTCDLVLDEPGVYFFTTSSVTACNNGQRLRLVVGPEGTVQSAPLLPTTTLMRSMEPHTTCTVVADASGSTTSPPTPAPTSPPTTGGSAAGSTSADADVVIGTTVAIGVVLLIVVILVVAKRWTKRLEKPTTVTSPVVPTYVENPGEAASIVVPPDTTCGI